LRWIGGAEEIERIYTERTEGTGNGLRCDPSKDTKRDAHGRAGGGATGGNRRAMAGTQPQRETQAVGAAESAKPQTDSADRGSAGTATNARALAGTVARKAERRHSRIGACGGTNRRAAGGDRTEEASERAKKSGTCGECACAGRLEVTGRTLARAGLLQGTRGDAILKLWIDS
jgi:hypothetical protein